MKKKMSIWYKIKLFIAWLRHDGSEGLITCCSFCQSTRVRRFGSFEYNASLNSKEYRATYICQNCKAVATAKERWYGDIE